MNRRSVRVRTRALALAGATSLLATGLLATMQTPAQADTEYDGEATALSISGLKLTLFPADAKLPAPFEKLIPRPDEQVIDLSAQLPNQVGHASFPGIDEPASLPANPLLEGGSLVASSARVGDRAVTEAKIGYLNIGGNALTIDNIVARCTADGSKISLDGPQGSVRSAISGEVELEPNTANNIPGLGSITWNQQTTDGATYGEVSNLVIDLQTNLDADVLQDVPEAMAAFEGTVKQVLKDLAKSAQNAGLPIPGNVNQLSGQPLYNVLDDVLSQIPTSQLPDLNSVLRLEGKITLASAACSQKATTTPVDHNPPNDNENSPPGKNSPPKGGETDEPPLADTGVSPWPIRAGLAGILAVAAGGFLVLRQRRHSPH